VARARKLHGGDDFVFPMAARARQQPRLVPVFCLFKKEKKQNWNNSLLQTDIVGNFN
jgi:hypothetical protein